MTVISGYLGAGKTTVINRLLAANHGKKLLILVNDFGSINIDEKLLASKDDDTIALTNGCVCCTMGADLFLALGDALDRKPRPDHIVIEASGISDPARIANAALAEPDMQYAGIVTLVDGIEFGTLIGDPLIGAQIRQQISKADLILTTKLPKGKSVPGLGDMTPSKILDGDDILALMHLLLSHPNYSQTPEPTLGHPLYTSWCSQTAITVDRKGLSAHLTQRPAGLFRLKGSVVDRYGVHLQVQVVGQQVDLKEIEETADPALVGIGLSEHVSLFEIDDWWKQIIA